MLLFLGAKITSLGDTGRTRGLAKDGAVLPALQSLQPALPSVLQLFRLWQ